MLPFNSSLAIRARYLHLPVKNGAPKITLRLLRKGVMQREFEIELALDGPADWWTFYDVSEFVGQTLMLYSSADISYAQTARLAAQIRQSDDIQGNADLYHERLRPQLHFTSWRGWINDPNGLVYARGQWHLFFQHNPFGVLWGNMHWGHAVSPDLIHWREQPTAIFPKSLKDMAFSGGALLDAANTAGFQTTGQHALVASFTSTGRGECLAYSLDDGLTFSEYTGNPVLKHVGRDPKIIWYEAQQKWVMIVYEETGDQRGYVLLDSRDLKHWNRLDFLPGFYECPELFELALDGDPTRRKWLVYGAVWEGLGSAYQLGSFDGRHFSAETPPLPAHFGPHFYAAQTFSNVPDGRRIMIGWLNGAAYPNMPFSQGMSVPLELGLRSTPDGARLCFNPVKELEELRLACISGTDLNLEQANQLLGQAQGELFDLSLSLLAEGQGMVTLEVSGQRVVWNPEVSEIEFCGCKAPLPGVGRELELRLLVDRSVMEVFADFGSAAFASMTLFEDDQRRFSLAGAVRVRSLSLHPLRSIWQPIDFALCNGQQPESQSLKR